ncbi:MAG: 5'-nucleotidase C-terminal domain-containing protein [Bacteroidaceae bacterium]|nr:5'-nucleotidase C-terminal domain-containing protein [Bacteroidaceae bacterium]
MFTRLPKLRFGATLATLLLTVTTALAQTATVAVFSLNDFHGGFLPDARKDIPGAPAVWQTLDSLRTVYPNSVTVAAGDNFGGSYFYNVTGGRLVPDFFSRIGVTLSAVGNHEFDDGQAKLADKWSAYRPAGWNLTYVCANVFDEQGRLAPFAQPCATQVVTLPTGQTVTLGFVGLLTSNTPNQTSKSKLTGLTFDGNYTGVIEALKRTPQYQPVQQADIRMLLTHVGTKMQDGHPVWDDRDSANIAAFNDPDFHALLTGHSHNPVCGRINASQYPVVQGKWHGEYISVVKFEIDLQTRKVLSATPEIVHVNPAIALGDKQRAYLKELESLLADTQIEGHSLSENVTYCTRNLVHDRTTDKYCQTEMGYMVCEAYAEAVRDAGHLPASTPVIGMSHFGSIRGGFPEGQIRILDVGEALPFANQLRVFRLKGEQIMEIVEFGLHNETYGWLQTSSLEIDTTKTGHVRELAYINADGTRTVLRKNRTYLVVADEFQSGGGDGYRKEYFPESQELRFTGMPTSTQAFINYLQRRPAIPGYARPCILPYKKLNLRRLPARL